MQVVDLTVEVRNSSLERVAQITEQELVGFTVVLRFNNVGSWKAVLPANSFAASQLREPGAGIVVTGPNGVIFTGPTTAAKKVQTSDDPEGTWEIEGVDDSVLLLERLAYPDPSQPDAGLQTTAYDEITGPTSTVLYHFVDANLGPSAPVERQVPSLVLAADTSLGSMITGKLRFEVLGSAFTKLVATDGLGFDVKQQGDELVFAVYEPVDRSAEIRLDVANNRLTSSEYTYQKPNVTRAIVAGQGQGEQREILEVASTESENSEISWGRRIEVFKDQRDAEDAALLEQAGLEILAQGGKTLEGISVKPSDDGLMRYGYDWNLGDKVSVVADQTTAVSTVTEVAISVTDSGIYVYATVGQPDIASDETRTNTVQNNQEDRISNLERNEPTGGGSGGGGGSVGYYGSFYDMTDQPLASITAAQAIAIGTTAEAIGISITSGNRVLFANAGTYSLTFSVQITNLGTTVAKSVFWVKKNGVDYADSATEMDLQPRKGAGNPNRQVITINYVATAAAGDYVQVFWAGDSLNLTVEALPAGSSPVYPAVPSIILTATQVGNSGLVVSPNAPTSTGVLWLDTDEPSDIPVPTGGTANQVLAKIDSTNYNTQWITPPSVPAGGTTGQVLTKINATDYNANWQTPVDSGMVFISNTIFTNQTQVDILDVFSTNYRRYKLIFSGVAVSGAFIVSMRLRSSSGTVSTANYNNQAVFFRNTSISGARTTAQTSWVFSVVRSTGGENCSEVIISNPFQTATTQMHSKTIDSNDAISIQEDAGIFTLTTSMTGITIFATAAMSGNVQIYGLRT
jgi:hypothetical protein